MTLSLEWEGIAIAVSHTPNWLNTEFDHIELRADQKLPVTETGYRSHFIADAELALFDGVEDFVRQWLGEAAQSPKWKAFVDDSRQLSLL